MSTENTLRTRTLQRIAAGEGKKIRKTLLAEYQREGLIQEAGGSFYLTEKGVKACRKSL